MHQSAYIKKHQSTDIKKHQSTDIKKHQSTYIKKHKSTDIMKHQSTDIKKYQSRYLSRMTYTNNVRNCSYVAQNALSYKKLNRQNVKISLHLPPYHLYLNNIQ